MTEAAPPPAVPAPAQTGPPAPYSPEAVAEAQARLDALGNATPEARLDALLTLLDALGMQDQPRRLALAWEARDEAERLGDTHRRALALGYEGNVHYLLSDHRAARARLTEAIEVLGEGAPEAARFRGWLAAVHNSLGDYEAAFTLAHQNLLDARARGDRQAEAWLLHGFSTALLENGEPEGALGYARDALAVFEELGLTTGVARGRSNIGSALLALGQVDEAEIEAAASLTLFRFAGDRLGESRALHDIGRVDFARGWFAAALEHHEQALALRRELGNRHAEAGSLIEAGRALTALGRPAEALPPLADALALAQASGARPREAQTHATLAEAHEAAGDLAAALRHLHAYQAVREEVVGQQARARIEALEARQEAERARHETEVERLRSVELAEANRRLEGLLDELRRTQGRLVQSEKLASLGRMVAGVAHELKNPLNFVNNFAALAQELVGELRDALTSNPARPASAVLDESADTLDDLAVNTRKIAEHGRRADGIVQSMLRHARQGGRERTPTDLHALLDQAVELSLRASADGPLVCLERRYAADVPAVAVVPQDVERVFVNLIENARYAVGRGGPGGALPPTIRISTERRGGHAVVRVEDNGPGIPPDAREKVFEPFFTTKPPGEGTGLGLSLAYDIVTQGHGGRIEACPSEMGGAAFVVALPV